MSTIGLASNVEVLLGILGELVEEEGKKSVDVLASSNSVADGSATVRVADIDGLIKEDDGSIGIPRVGVVNNLDLVVDGSRAELHKEASER